MRPRRKRKLTNYGEGHLHWIEESQLHKALMKSLREKSSTMTLESDDKDCAGTSKLKVPSRAKSVDKIKNRNSEACKIENIGTKTGKATSSKAKSPMNDEAHECAKKPRKLRFKGDSGSTLSDSMLSHATMMQPSNNESSLSDSQTMEKASDKDADNTDNTLAHNLKTIAQRKFASNSSQNTRHGSRIEKKLKKCGRANADDKCEPISDKPMPRTKDFINYVCFRNTPFHFELEDST